jgi:hypothetical protein
MADQRARVSRSKLAALTRPASAGHPPPVVTGPPEALPPRNLSEFLAVYCKPGPAWPGVADLVAEMVTAAAEGGEPPPLERLDSAALLAVGSLLDELGRHDRMFPAGIHLLQQVRRDYWRRVEIVPPPAREPGESREPRRPTARLKPAPGPVFRLDTGTLSVPVADAADRLRRMADAGAAAAGFLRSLAAGVAAGPGEADTRALDSASRAAVGALLRAGGQAQQGPDGDAMALPQALAAWTAWERETAQ